MPLGRLCPDTDEWGQIVIINVLTRYGRQFFLDPNKVLVRFHFIIEMIRWTGLAPWEFEFPFPGSLTSTFLEACQLKHRPSTEWGQIVSINILTRIGFFITCDIQYTSV